MQSKTVESYQRPYTPQYKFYQEIFKNIATLNKKEKKIKWLHKSESSQLLPLLPVFVYHLRWRCSQQSEEQELARKVMDG